MAVTCRDLKKTLRAPWDRPMREEQRALVRARRRATELLILLAHAHGRIHAATLDPALHARIAEALAPAYAIVDEVAP